MELIHFHSIYIIFIIILNLYKSLSIMGPFMGNIIPENYKLTLNFSDNNDCLMNKCIYTGEVTITMTVAGRANSFFIQSDPETIIQKSRTRLYRINSNATKIPMTISNYVYTRGDTSLIIEIQIDQIFQIISESQFELTMYFTRTFDDHRGYYNTSSNIHSDSILMITQLSSNRAHRLFPCLNDQHKWTSSYEITVIYPSKYNIMTGITLQENKMISPGTNISIYEKTKKIPTEHLFFVIWRYNLHLVGPLKFWFPPGVEYSDYSSMITYTMECLKWITHATSTIAPVQPVMNIAPISGSRIIDYYVVPGVILYKKQRVLYDIEESSKIDKMELITTVSRAVATQWIGVFIYPKLRSDYWIYKALANYAADYIINVVEPKFRNKEFTLARTILWTRSDRDLDASTTIPFYLFDTWEDKMYFRREDYTGYQTMTIISMIHEIYDFNDVGLLITQALVEWGHTQFGPDKDELFSILRKENVEELIRDWSKMPGIPIIHVALDLSEENAELIQERFNPSEPWSDEEYTWTIPIRCKNFSTNTYYFQWMMPNTSFLISADEIRTCLLYTDTVVPYRVNYPEKWWTEIINTLLINSGALGEMQKMRIIDDLLELCFAGYIHIRILFKLLLYLSNEMDYFPWLAGTKAFTKIRGILSTSKTDKYRLYYRRLVTDIVSNIYDYLENNIGEISDDYIHMHRKNIANIACGFGHEKCLRDAESRLHCYLREVLHANCRNGRCFNYWKKCIRNSDEHEMIFCHGIRRASIELWITVLKLLNKTNLFPSIRLSIARGLACTENVDVLENYIYYVLEQSEIFPSDHIFPILLTAARINELNAQVILHFIIKNHDKLVARLELPYEYQKHVYALSEDIYYLNMRKNRIHVQGSPLVYSELPDGVRNILQVNTIRANRLRPMIENYLDDYFKNVNP